MLSVLYITELIAEGSAVWRRAIQPFLGLNFKLKRQRFCEMSLGTKPQPFQALLLGKTFELLAENNFRIKIIHGYFTPRDLPKGMEACPELLGN